MPDPSLPCRRCPHAAEVVFFGERDQETYFCLPCLKKEKHFPDAAAMLEWLFEETSEGRAHYLEDEEEEDDA